MAKGNHIISILLLSILVTSSIFSITAQGCKDIVACGDATSGDYNLMLKVRDPSRLGYQVLDIVPEGYEYTYHHPWNGNPIEYIVQNKFIGVVTKGDELPNIAKPGMALSDAGLAYGDADSMSNWKNPTRHAWDDFDWIRYACQSADTEDEAIDLLTKEVVDELHATGVSENLFVVGPTKGAVIEADVIHYDVKEFINGIAVMSNYPKELWQTQRHNKLPIARSFDTVKEQEVRKGRVLRLDSLYGVKIVDVKDEYILARQVPFIKITNKMVFFMGQLVKINIGERQTVGDYSVTLLDIHNKRATISLSYVFKAWEDAMTDYVEQDYGSITLQDMMHWSRLHEEELDELRPMCEDRFPYESAMVYKIPEEHYKTMSSGWFAANHPCVSIYVPVHIADTEIYEAYTTGEAAQVSIELLELYGHETLSPLCTESEDVFLAEMEVIESIALAMTSEPEDMATFLTISDMGIQEQAFRTQLLWIDVGIEGDLNKQEIIENIWSGNYSSSLREMEHAVRLLETIPSSTKVIDDIVDIALSICNTRLQIMQTLGKDTTEIDAQYREGKRRLAFGDYSDGFEQLQQSFDESTALLFDIYPSTNLVIDKESEECCILLPIGGVAIGLLLVSIGALMIKYK